MALVINMYGGPGRGKSTTAYKLIGLLKHNDYKSELVTEYVKHSAYIGNNFEIQDQIFLLAQHNHRLRILEQQVDIIVTDGSLLNTLAYCTRDDQKVERDLSMELYNRYDNIGFIVPRKTNYMRYGRSQTKEEAMDLDTKIFDAISYLPSDQVIDLRYLEQDMQNSKDNDLVLKTIYQKTVEEAEFRGIKPKLAVA